MMYNFIIDFAFHSFKVQLNILASNQHLFITIEGKSETEF